MNTEDVSVDAALDFARAAMAGKRAGGCASHGEHAAFVLGKKAIGLSLEMQSMDRSLQEGFCSLLILLAWPDTRAAMVNILRNPPAPR